ncbi:MAG TPA: class I SAM-dependent methyltransferase [Acidimicrobiales bacterium]|nr:class I SAM-dependent methyltransferase [Acidimicrobiales bacterium]
MSEPEHRGDTDPGLWADPVPTYDKVARSYAEKFVDELDHKPFDQELLTRYAGIVGPRSSRALPVCDLGCGPGHIGAYLAERGVDVLGIDLSPGMVAQARRSFPALRFAPGDMTALDLPAGSLAGIVCFYALIHIPRVRVSVALTEMRRSLVAGGQLLLSVHGGVGSLHASEMLEHPVSLDATLFTLSELRAVAEAAGFEVREAHERPPYDEEIGTPRLYVWATSGT